jgi:futalosine hydrolase
MGLTVVITAVDVERDAIADGIGEPHEIPVGPYLRSKRCETDGDDVLVMAGGIGPAAAAAAAAYAVGVHDVTTLLSMGIAGAFAASALPMGGVAIASTVVAADLGAMSPERFLDLGAMGLDGGAAVTCDAGLVETARERVTRAALPVAVGPVLTLSTMTGTTERAAQLMSEHGAVAEAMEGAGVAHVAALHGLPTLEVRTVSNYIGVRDRASWDILAALTSLTTVGRVVLGPGW